MFYFKFIGKNIMNDFIKKLETLKKQISNIDESHKETFLNAVDQSINFTKKLPEFIPHPDVQYTLDGDVFFFWDKKIPCGFGDTSNNKVFVAFYGTDIGEYGYTYKDNGEFIPGKEEAKIDLPIPLDLLNKLELMQHY